MKFIIFLSVIIKSILIPIFCEESCGNINCYIDIIDSVRYLNCSSDNAKHKDIMRCGYYNNTNMLDIINSKTSTELVDYFANELFQKIQSKLSIIKTIRIIHIQVKHIRNLDFKNLTNLSSLSICKPLIIDYNSFNDLDRSRYFQLYILCYNESQNDSTNLSFQLLITRWTITSEKCYNTCDCTNMTSDDAINWKYKYDIKLSLKYFGNENQKFIKPEDCSIQSPISTTISSSSRNKQTIQYTTNNPINNSQLHSTELMLINLFLFSNLFIIFLITIIGFAFYFKTVWKSKKN